MLQKVKITDTMFTVRDLKIAYKSQLALVTLSDLPRAFFNLVNDGRVFFVVCKDVHYSFYDRGPRRPHEHGR